MQTHGASQRDKDRVGGLTRKASVQFAAPPPEQFERPLARRRIAPGLIRQIIRPAAEGIDRPVVIAPLFGHKS